MQQIKIIKYIVAILLSAVFFSSCVNLRYTDYGRPLDFLKSKNTHYAQYKTKKDTANVFVLNINDTEVDSIIDTLNIAATKNTFQEKSLPKTLEESDVITKSNLETAIDKSSSLVNEKHDNSEKSSFLNKSHKPIFSTRSFKIKTKNQTIITPGPWPDWWYEFWGSVFGDILKWVIIALLWAVAAIIVAIGVYYLALLIGGEIAAAIVIIIIVIAIYVIWDIDLTWLLYFL